VSPFGGFADDPTDDHWKDLAGLVGPRGTAALTGVIGVPPSGWTVLLELSGVQMVGDALLARSVGAGGPAWPGNTERERPDLAGANTADYPEDPPIPLHDEDVADMLALAERARPGPFLSRTVEFGGYVGIRREGRLVAMAGERLRPPGFAEVSAVATDPDYRRQGLAHLVVRSVLAAIVGRGEVPFLHVETANAGAIRLYESMGFTARKAVSILVVQAAGPV
jgi:ribosomal protein S18 acetylase RimI-like enzyme